MVKIYFYKYETIKKFSQYKKNWFEQIYIGIKNYGKQLSIVENILDANIILTIVDFMDEIEGQYNLKELGIKLIIIACQDVVTIIKKVIINPNVLYIFDHLKLSFVPSIFYFSNNSYSYSKYLLNEYYKYESDKNYIYNIDIEFKTLYELKTQCILNTSNLYRKIFDKNCLKLSDRKYDIIYIGNLNFDGLLLSHRKDPIEKLKELSQKHNLKIYLGENSDGNKLPLHKYYRILKNAKLCISTWGWGEWSLKEFECICFGTHCLIPLSQLNNYPNFNENWDKYQIDFTDFEEKILNILSNISKTQEKIDLNRKIFLEYSNKNQIDSIEKLICK